MIFRTKIDVIAHHVTRLFSKYQIQREFKEKERKRKIEV
jgi:hypothetical protein